MALPFLSRSSHDEIVRAKEQVIAALQQQIDALHVRLQTPQPVAVQLPEGFAVLQPAIVRSPRTRVAGQAQSSQPDIDFAQIDENDPAVMAEVLKRYGGASMNKWERRQAVTGLRQQIRSAKDSRLRARVKEAAQTVARESRSEPTDGEDGRVEAAVPAHIREKIERAERGED